MGRDELNLELKFEFGRKVSMINIRKIAFLFFLFHVQGGKS